MADDWTDDADFDFEAAPSFLNGGSPHIHHLPPRDPSTIATRGAGVKTQANIGGLDAFDDLEDDSDRHTAVYAKQDRERSEEALVDSALGWDRLHAPRSRTTSKASDILRSGQVTAPALGGRAFITNLGANQPLAHKQNAPSTRASPACPEAWEQGTDDLCKLELKPTVAVQDDKVDWEIDDDDDDGRDATLKVGRATIKGLKAKIDMQTIRPDCTSNGRHTKYSEDLEDDRQEESFNLPSTLSHLKLASPAAGHECALRHKSSRSSVASTSQRSSDWDSPGSLIPGNTRYSAQRSSTTSPSTSMTSVMSLSMVATDNSESDDRAMNAADEEEDDIEQGLLLPNPSFFSSGRVQELNTLLDRKRKPQPFSPNYPPTPNGGTRTTSANSRSSSADLTRPTIASAARARANDRREEPFEDGLLLDDAAAELNHLRLNRLRNLRAGESRSIAAVQQMLSPGRSLPRVLLNASGTSRGFIGLEDMSRFTASAAHSARPRSPAAPAVRVTSGQSSQAEESPSSVRSRNTESRPATNPSPSRLQSPSLAAYTPSRLRHQQSYSYLQQPPSSPSLSRKQSLQSLKDVRVGQTGDARNRLNSNSARPAVPSAPSYESQTASSAARTLRRDREKKVNDLPPPALSAGSAGRSSNLGSAGRSSNFSSSGRSSSSSEQAVVDRLTMPTSSTKAKARPAIHTVFAGVSPPRGSQTTISPPKPSQLLRRPQTSRTYGDGTELDAFDDLQVDKQKETMLRATVSAPYGVSRTAPENGSIPEVSSAPSRFSATPNRNPAVGEKRKKAAFSGRSRAADGPPRRAPALIRKLGGDGDKHKTVGDMTWNPQTQRWEGNYGVLRAFDGQLPNSVRPALINPNNGVLEGGIPTPGDITASASSVHIVGDMRFDTDKMCWVSTLSPEDDEPDPFEGIGDDEDEDEDRLATITRSSGKALSTGSLLLNINRRITSESAGSSSTCIEDDSVDSAGRPGSQPVCVSDALRKQCLDARARHKDEMRGWVIKPSQDSSEMAERMRRDARRLWEIRKLALGSS